MPNRLQNKWKVSNKDFVLILCVFAVTGFTTAFLSKAVTGWAGFTDGTHWSWKLLLRLSVLIFGYQIILLAVAFLFGQFPFFWKFERKFLQRLGFIKKESPANEESQSWKETSQK